MTLTLTDRSRLTMPPAVNFPAVTFEGPEIATQTERCCRCNREILTGSKLYHYRELAIGPACIDFVRSIEKFEVNPKRIAELAREGYRQYIRELTISAMRDQGLL